MLQKLVPDAISGTAQLRFGPDGLRWEISFPLDS
jgi:hypothetical protein